MDRYNGGYQQVFIGWLTAQTFLFFLGYRYGPLTFLKHLRGC